MGADRHEASDTGLCPLREHGYNGPVIDPETGQLTEGDIMTQLVAAICEDGEAVVAVADRMITYQLGAYEPDMVKAEMLAPKALIMMTGNPSAWPEIVAGTQIHTADETPVKRLSDIARHLACSFRIARERHVCGDVLSKHVGLWKMEDWRAAERVVGEGQGRFGNGLIADYKLGLTIVLCGVDLTGGHIYITGDFKERDCQDVIGFCCRGAGSTHASTTFIRRRYSKTMRRNEATYIAFEAKKMAELSPQVGTETDIWLIDKKGVGILSEDCIKELEKIYKRRERRAERVTVKKDLEGFEIERGRWDAGFAKLEAVLEEEIAQDDGAETNDPEAL